MPLISENPDCFGPEDIKLLDAALKQATHHFEDVYGFSGKSLKAAQNIAAFAAIKNCQNGIFDMSDLVEVAIDAVRSWIKGGRIIKDDGLVARDRSRHGIIWINYTRLTDSNHPVLFTEIEKTPYSLRPPIH